MRMMATPGMAKSAHQRPGRDRTDEDTKMGVSFRAEGQRMEHSIKSATMRDRVGHAPLREKIINIPVPAHWKPPGSRKLGKLQAPDGGGGGTDSGCVKRRERTLDRLEETLNIPLIHRATHRKEPVRTPEKSLCSAADIREKRSTKPSTFSAAVGDRERRLEKVKEDNESKRQERKCQTCRPVQSSGADAVPKVLETTRIKVRYDRSHHTADQERDATCRSRLAVIENDRNIPLIHRLSNRKYHDGLPDKCSEEPFKNRRKVSIVDADRGRSPTPATEDAARTLTRKEKSDLQTEIWKVFHETVKIPRNETSEALGIIEPLIEEVLNFARKDKIFKSMKRLNAGSHYEKLKICKSDEIDVMLCLEDVQKLFEYEEPWQAPGYLYINVKHWDRSKWKDVCTSSGYLSSVKMRDYFEKNVVIGAVEAFQRQNREYRVSVVGQSKSKDECSPAVTVTVETDGMEYCIDLVLAINVGLFSDFQATRGWTGGEWLRKKRADIMGTEVYAVAKNPPEGLGDDMTSVERTWRLSFSKAEKCLLLKADTSAKSPTCRKECFRIFKYMIQLIKEQKKRQFASLTSYHLKTTFLHYCAERPRDQQWMREPIMMLERLTGLVEYFLHCIESKNLPHFFVQNSNMFSSFERVTLREIEKNVRERALNCLKRGDMKWITGFNNDSSWYM
ncbi:cyclic GMP-AMP synthase-like [Ptychodera flava]|uniref:cyclic GMP-AMP synthase-like n=1 Tax=Ptychodera flava TaxID=63121 RepID=UPI00396A793A